jgi:hypothetical protein
VWQSPAAHPRGREHKTKNGMKERRIEHTYDCSADVFWSRIFLDDAYNQKLFLEELHFESWRVIRSEERGTEIQTAWWRRCHGSGAARSAQTAAQNEGASYQEARVLDRAGQRYRWRSRRARLPAS